MNEITTQYEALFRELGRELGRALAARLLEERAAADGGFASPPEPAAAQAGKILPGLTGRRRRAGDPPPRCGRAGCNKPSRTRGYCQTHYVQWLKAGDGRRQAG
ncbi:hypothetical protein [Vulgatibacter sp.]|uniref:hypothetical protein n=1 Tax=Vulgatibacter sp. TaxID=1971226 RepID=UPI0035696E7F